VIPLAALCLAGERRIGEPFPVQQFFAGSFRSAGIIPDQYLQERNESATSE
jgi:hypothetical protein